jgi:hypothetical protein
MCSPAATLEILAVVLDKLNVIIDRLNELSVQIVHVASMKMQKYVSKGTIWRQYLKSDQVEI